MCNKICSSSRLCCILYENMTMRLMCVLIKDEKNEKKSKNVSFVTNYHSLQFKFIQFHNERTAIQINFL